MRVDIAEPVAVEHDVADDQQARRRQIRDAHRGHFRNGGIGS
jgi:hypothetical protein